MPKKRFCLNPSVDQGQWGFGPTPMRPEIVAAAKAKGFTAVGRLSQKGYYALRCDHCGAMTKARNAVVRDSQPSCHACLAEKHRAKAAGLGFMLLAREATERAYAFYRLPCGHVGRRQMGLLHRVAAGETNLRCKECLAERQKAEAAVWGWTLVGTESISRPNYRLYRHEGCGSVQAVAVANMKTGRFDCNSCGQTWSAAPSALYAMRFALADGDPVVKLGYSRNPVSRLHHQLLSGLSTTGEILRIVRMPSGSAAIRSEKAMHRVLRVELPEAVVPACRYRGQINVRSEIYLIAALPRILALLDEEAARHGQGCTS